jgi:hypothetical protein
LSFHRFTSMLSEGTPSGVKRFASRAITQPPSGRLFKIVSTYPECLDDSPLAPVKVTLRKLRIQAQSPNDLDFLNIALDFHFCALRLFVTLRKLFPAEGFPIGDHKNYIVGRSPFSLAINHLSTKPRMASSSLPVSVTFACLVCIISSPFGSSLLSRLSCLFCGTRA